MSNRPSLRAASISSASPTNAELHRRLSLRHILFIALGSAIGTGLFYGSAGAISLAGPSVLLAYVIGGAAVFMVMRAMGEMALAHPVAGAFSEYATRYLGRWAGFVTGWTYAFEMALVAVADVTAFAVYMQFWFPHSPSWVWIAVVLLIILSINLVHVKAFGESEFWFTVIKVGAIIAMIIGGILLMLFGVTADNGQPATVANLWQQGGFFANGFGGFIACFTVVMFAFGGIETIGIAAGEAENPKLSIPKAVNTTPVRILLFYVLALAVIMSLMPWQTINGETSPFVQIFNSLGIPAAAHVLNFVVLTAAISAINADVYGAGRMLFGLAQRNMAPRSFAKLDRRGAPYMTVVSMILVLIVGVLINVFFENAFLVVASLATFATVMVWVMILISHIAFKRQLTREGATSEFPTPAWPWASYLALAFMLAILVQFAFFEDTRLALLVGAIWSVLLFILYKMLPKTQEPSAPITESTQR
ncbi:MAG: amino acid permease [Rothia sp. (in: high G+C Gram-positive bacteria)]|nr:amino acid permease [Rothia sp. (in: high G+C Gram-positive bacteria)]